MNGNGPLLVVCLFLFYVSVKCCGPITHMIVSSRARTHFKAISSFSDLVDYNQLVKENQDAFLAGSVYPDAFYSQSCEGGHFRFVSEDTHWSGFLKTSINYIRDRHSLPWDKHTKKLVVFLLGVISHQVSDILWHGIGLDTGFVPALANINYHGNYEDAHIAADFGSDIVNQYMFQLKEFMVPQLQWYVPVDDLYRIYKQMYGMNRLTSNTIQSCATIQIMSIMSQLHFGKMGFKEVAKTSPFLVDHQQDYYIGGIGDMAGHTDRMWQAGITMIENGTDSCTMPRNPLFIDCSLSSKKDNEKQTDMHRTETNGYFVEPNLRGLSVENLEINRTKRGITLNINMELQTRINDLKRDRNNMKRQLKTAFLKAQTTKRLHARKNSLKEKTLLRYSLLRLNSSYSKIGWSYDVADVDGDGNNDAVMGAPGYSTNGSPQQGSVSIVHGNEKGILDNRLYAVDITRLRTTLLIPGPYRKQSRFGSSVAILDINLDGIMDIAVGAPSYSKTDPLGHFGAVFIYLGAYNKRFTSDQDPNITISCQKRHCNLGFSLTTIDLNRDGFKDLIIGSPFYNTEMSQSGAVSTLLAKDSVFNEVILFEDLFVDWHAFGKQDYSWFGYTLQAKDDILFIGEPNFSLMNGKDKNDTTEFQRIGALRIFNFGQKHKIPNTTLYGKENYDMVGTSVDIGHLYGAHSTVLAVGFPGASVKGSREQQDIHIEQAGSVIIYNISASGRKKVLARYDGDRVVGRFGASVKLTDVNEDGYDDLLIGAPLRKNESVELLDPMQMGKMYLYLGGPKMRQKSVTNTKLCKLASPCPEQMANYTTYEENNAYLCTGSKLAVLKSEKKVNILVTSSRGDEGMYIKELEPGFVELLKWEYPF